MFSPHRGPHKAKFVSEGVSHSGIIKLMEYAQQLCLEKGEEDAAFRFEMLVEYFRKDYVPGKPIKLNAMMLGF